VENPLAQWHHVYAVSAYTWRHCASDFVKLVFLPYFLQILLFAAIKKLFPEI